MIFTRLKRLENCMFKAACLQMRAGIKVKDNLDQLISLFEEAVSFGADYIQSPEMSNILQPNRPLFFEEIQTQSDDVFLKEMMRQARLHKKYLHLGSLAIKIADTKAVNRGFMINPSGEIIASYDKIHMFDVTLPEGTILQESTAYEAGKVPVIAKTPLANIAMTICYDMRFPHLYRHLAQNAPILTAPSSFTVPTGKAHWHVLLRARAIETGSYMIAAAQGGKHECGRETYGHSLIINPWGEIIAEKADDEMGVIVADINPDESRLARQRIPSLLSVAFNSPP
jgi:deaminated glutathione amidase